MHPHELFLNLKNGEIFMKTSNSMPELKNTFAQKEKGFCIKAYLNDIMAPLEIK